MVTRRVLRRESESGHQEVGWDTRSTIGEGFSEVTSGVPRERALIPLDTYLSGRVSWSKFVLGDVSQKMSQGQELCLVEVPTKEGAKQKVIELSKSLGRFGFTFTYKDTFVYIKKTK